MIPEYNKINFETDDLIVIDAKKKILEKAVDNGQLSQEEFEEEKARVMKSYGEYLAKHKILGYAFTW